MKNGILFGVLLGLFWTLTAQERDSRLATTVAPLATIDQYVLPKMDNEALRQAELERRRPGIAPRFAESVEVDISPQNHGDWEKLPSGNWVWRMRIYSATAKSLNLGFSEYEMPPGGTLVLYSPDEQEILGPFTPADNEEHAQLWTPVLLGESMVIEVQVPESQRSRLRLKATSINHDFLGFAQAMSGSCNLDVICGVADGWGIVDNYRDIIESVGVYGFNGNTFCTGFLVNNTALDCTPFFMTANHCGINANNAPSLVVYWNYERATCRQPNTGASGAPGGPLPNQFNTGSVWRAGWNGSDFSLVELDDPVDLSTEPFFAGWDATNASTGDSVVCIHHPGTDEKRISFEFNSTQIGNGNGNPSPSGNFVIVPDWDIGTTEGGSSGSPLFNKQQRVIGQLLGGGAACGNNLEDVYGWFHRSWTGGGSPTTRLSDWLDPAGTGQLVLDGKNCSAILSAVDEQVAVCSPADAIFSLKIGSGFSDTVQLTVTGLPVGTVVNYSMNPVPPGGSSQLILSNLAGLGLNSYPFSVLANDGTDTSLLALTLVVDFAVPVVSLSTPTDAASPVSPGTPLIWQSTPTESYDLQVATDSLFTLLTVNETGLSGGIYSVQSLQEESTYYWRVRGSNACGTGLWTERRTFQTGAFFCESTSAAGLPITISSGPPSSISSTVNITQAGQLEDLNIRHLQITHSWVEDLTISLTSPAGTTVQLMMTPNCTESNLDLAFDDQATQSYADLLGTCNFSSPAIAGTFQPAEPLSVLIGESVQGLWTLTVSDGSQQDGGALVSWDLELCATVEKALGLETDSLIVCAGADTSLTLRLGAAFNATPGVFFSLTGLPPGASYGISPLPGSPNSTVSINLNQLHAVGTYQIGIQGTDGTSTRFTTLYLQIHETPVLSLLTPGDASSQWQLDPTLRWAVTNTLVDTYIVEIATDTGFTQIEQTLMTRADSIQVDSLDYAGIYYWRVRAVNACGEALSSAYSLRTLWQTSLEENWGMTIRLFPNPAREQTTLVFSQPLPQPLSWQVYNLAGQRLATGTLAVGVQEQSLDLQGLCEGIYLLRIQSGTLFWSERVMVQALR